MKFKFTGSHPEDLDSGRVLAPGEVIELSDEDVKSDRVKQLVADGRLIKEKVKRRQQASGSGSAGSGGSGEGSKA